MARTASYDGLAVAAAQPHTQVRPFVAPCWFFVPAVPTRRSLPRVPRWTRPSGGAPLSRYALSFAHRFVGSPNGGKKKAKWKATKKNVRPPRHSRHHQRRPTGRPLHGPMGRWTHPSHALSPPHVKPG